MKDACTQTERSDYKRIKEQMMAKQKKEQQEMRANLMKQN